jgi:hypothetical protein
MSFITQACRIGVFVALASLPFRAQQASGTATATGRVSAVAAVSAGAAARVVKGDAQISAEAAGAQGLILSMAGTRGGETRIEIPVQLRSNVDFALTASFKTRGATLCALSVVEVGRAGAFVYPGTAGRVEVTSQFDGRPGAHTPRSSRPEASSPATILTGPPISMGGPLDSPGNMIEVVLRVVLTAPYYKKGWDAELKVSAAPRVGAEQPTSSAPAVRWE